MGKRIRHMITLTGGNRMSRTERNFMVMTMIPAILCGMRKMALWTVKHRHLIWMIYQ